MCLERDIKQIDNMAHSSKRLKKNSPKTPNYIYKQENSMVFRYYRAIFRTEGKFIYINDSFIYQMLILNKDKTNQCLRTQ